MKLARLISFFLLSLLHFLCEAQIANIKIKYVETSYMEPMKDMPPQMAANFPKSRKVNKILLINDSSSLYIVNKVDKIEENLDQNRGRWAMKRQGVDNIQFIDYYQTKMTTFTDLFGKEFLVEEVLPEYSWKIHAGEQREILGYACIKATTTIDDSIVVTAWYTTKINTSCGPSGYWGLPGVILAVSEGENKVTLAYHLDLNLTSGDVIEKPTKGESINRQDFNKLRQEKIKEMRDMYGGGGNGNNRVMIFRGG